MDLFSPILFLECLDEIDQNVQTILDKLTTFDGFLAIQFLFKLMHNTRQPQHQTKHVTHSKYTSYINTINEFMHLFKFNICSNVPIISLIFVRFSTLHL